MEKANTKITIITVCYNAVNLIDQTIQSVIGQTYPNVEYIVVDGASTDGTIDLIKKYDKKITRFVSEKDGGIYDAMNKGIIMATGEWVLFMNAGDTFFSKDVLSKIFSAKKYLADVIFGDTLNHYKWGYVISEGRPFNGVERRMPFCHQSSFVRRTVLMDNKFEMSFRVSADHNQFYSLYLSGYKFLHLPMIISIFDTTGISGYSIKGVKEVCQINGYGTLLHYKVLICAYIRVGLSKIIPNSILDMYRHRKYIRCGQVYLDIDSLEK